jgi:superfamily II DNA or RNA helicase
VTSSPSSQGLATQFAPGARVIVRGEEWVVRRVEPTGYQDQAVHVDGISELVRGREAIFLHPGLDLVRVLDPRETELVSDDSPGYRRSRLYLESLLRRSPPTDHGIYLGHRGAMKTAAYQLVPAARALAQARPRLLIADAVGLGKTIEVGILLSELIRRGRGRRILVVTLKSVLEQFQHELWGRFTIPLVRLDSDGLMRVQRDIPANANPFYHFDRVIISVDTLKKDTKYARLLSQCRWDITVIDECQHVAARGNDRSQRAKLAALLASTCDALVLTSATPHDGRAESFASLMNLLEPTAVPNVQSYKAEQIRDLYVRRFKKDVAKQSGQHFMERRLERHDVPANEPEDALYRALKDAVFATLRTQKGVGGRAILFRTLLLKGLLSSPDALLQTLEERLKRLRERVEADSQPVQADVAHLQALRELCEDARRVGSSKEKQLVTLLRQYGVHQGKERVVVFSERIKTLERLEQVLRKELKLGAEQVRLFHGGTDDLQQQAVVKEFGTADGKIRVLLASDAAAEGINLHYQCHRLVHFDIPWSLITLEQRNGRIDRFGQEQRPHIHYVLARPGDPALRGDLQVLDRLLEKEQQAHDNLGDAQWLMQLYDADAEAERVAAAISQHEDPDDLFADPDRDLTDLLAPENDAGESPVVDGEASPALAGTEVETRDPMSLFADDLDYARTALRLLQDAGNIDAPEHHEEVRGVVLALPEDLKRRFDYLPAELRRACEGGFIKLSADRALVQRSLAESRRDKNRFPEWQLLWPLHPVMEWLDDRVLTQFARHEAPVLSCHQGLGPNEVAFLMGGVFSNAASQPVLVRWVGVIFSEGAEPALRPLPELALATGLGGALHNDGLALPLSSLLPLRTRAVEAASTWLLGERDLRRDQLLPQLKAEKRRVQAWRRERNAQLELALGDEHLRRDQKSRLEREREEIEARFRERDTWIQQRLATTGAPYVRLAAVLVPSGFEQPAAEALCRRHVTRRAVG